jgi:P-type E1-E2 ATPase
MVSSGHSASMGILIKGGDSLESCKKATSILFDKTGTLTEGKLSVVDVIDIENIENLEYFWNCIILLESSSNHPIGKSLVQFSKNQLILNHYNSKNHFINFDSKNQIITMNNDSKNQIITMNNFEYKNLNIQNFQLIPGMVI